MILKASPLTEALVAVFAGRHAIDTVHCKVCIGTGLCLGELRGHQAFLVRLGTVDAHNALVAEVNSTFRTRVSLALARH